MRTRQRHGQPSRCVISHSMTKGQTPMSATELATEAIAHTAPLRNAILAPRPVQQPRPVIVRAGSSPTRMDFAARYADFGFQIHPETDQVAAMNKRLRQIAAGHGGR
jgi:alkanesulfonate monooxygenase SsuD/methylene tetrahydromethanopterin reductase-like flavin-dependent oxidoreductase (luciferase family)